jgi:hypothetical protein
MRPAPLLALLPVATLALACARDPVTGAPATLTSAEVPATSPADNGRARLHALEGHLSFGKAWGGDATARGMSGAIVTALVREADFDPVDIGVAVEILPYQPRRVVAIVDLKFLPAREQDRRAVLDHAQGAIEGLALAGDEIVLGVREASAYVVVARGHGDGTAWDVRIGAGVSHEPLEQALGTSK